MHIYTIDEFLDKHKPEIERNTEIIIVDSPKLSNNQEVIKLREYVKNLGNNKKFSNTNF